LNIEGSKKMDAFRKATLFGMGAAAMSWEKIRQAIDDLVERGDMSAEEGKRVFDEVTSHIEEEGRSLNERVRGQVRDALKEMGLADRSQVAMLESRIEALERRVTELSAESTAQQTRSETG
jgi:polyhydroxyalkanoate synthesis regulator phasin